MTGAPTQELPVRKPTRLKGFDYSLPGAYFVTICTFGRACILGEIAGEEVTLTAAGEVVVEELQRSAVLRPLLTVDASVVMPNHVHALVTLAERATRRSPLRVEGASQGVVPGRLMAFGERATGRSPLRVQSGPRSGSLGAFVAGFKASSARRVNELRGTRGSPVWQRNYYEHVVRDESDLEDIYAYILTNPASWERDRDNPSNLAIPRQVDPIP